MKMMLKQHLIHVTRSNSDDHVLNIRKIWKTYWLKISIVWKKKILMLKIDTKSVLRTVATNFELTFTKIYLLCIYIFSSSIPHHNNVKHKLFTYQITIMFASIIKQNSQMVFASAHAPSNIHSCMSCTE